jgi:NosR/NirI family transcriptional regulator, nitrous oxide reductase regulator
MKKIRIYLLAITVLSSIAGHFLFPEKLIDERGPLREILPDVKFSEKKNNPPYYRSDEGYIAFNSYDISPSIRGYAGPIKTLVVLTPEGRIAGIKVLDHKETKNYIHYMETPQYLAQFIGKSINDPFEVDRDIDGITRATVSLEALAKTVKESSGNIASNVLGLEVRTESKRTPSGYGWLIYSVLFCLAFVFYYMTRRSKKMLRTRDISLIAGILIIGLYLSSPFSILHVFNILLLRPSASLLWYAIIITTILSIMLAGRFYCGWLCPFGALSEFIGRLPFRKWRIPSEMDDKWRNLKYLLLGLIVSIVFISRRAEFGNYETYVTLFSFHGNYLTWILVVTSLMANIRIERFWCRYLCPVAAFTGLFSRKDRGYVSRNDCPVANKSNPHISECIRCNRCYSK